jgi:hypothetical protein
VVLAACGGASGNAADEGNGSGVVSSTVAPTTTVSFPGPAAFDQPPSALYNLGDPSFPEPLIDLDLLRAGGPPPDGIAPIDDPKYIKPEDVRFLVPQDAVLVVDINGDARAFPTHIMIWHEIVNTEIGGVPVTVSYCPLCNSAVAFERTHADGTVMDFGTSGLLFQSSLVMFDRQTASLWTHFDGLAVHGALTGNQLELIPVSTVSFDDFARAHPDGLVLSRDTGFQRQYGSNPYLGYDTGGGDGLSHPVEYDARAAGLARVIAFRGDESIAIFQEFLAEERVVAIEFDGREVVAWLEPGTATPLQAGTVAFGRDVGATGVFLPVVDGQALTFAVAEEGDGFVDEQTSSRWNVLGRAVSGPLEGSRLEPVEHLDTFWFAIAAFRPDTILVGVLPESG